MSPYCVYVVNGINNNPSNVTGFTDAVRRECINRHIPVSCYEYPAGPFSCFLTAGYHARKIKEDMGGIRLPPRYVGHSHAGHICSKLLTAHKGLILHDVHLFAPACDPDCEANGFNQAIRDGRIQGDMYIYCSKKDKALTKWAPISRVVTLGLSGHKSMGSTGPINHISTRIHTVWDNTMDHCDWYKGNEIRRTVDYIIATA